MFVTIINIGICYKAKKIQRTVISIKKSYIYAKMKKKTNIFLSLLQAQCQVVCYTCYKLVALTIKVRNPQRRIQSDNIFWQMNHYNNDRQEIKFTNQLIFSKCKRRLVTPIDKSWLNIVHWLATVICNL